jgi:hypothetical protein
MTDALWWALLGVCVAINLWTLARTIRRDRQAKEYVVTAASGMPLGMFCLWSAPSEGYAPLCPRCGEEVYGLLAPNPSPQASVHTIPCDHVLTPDQGMALRMAATDG